MQSSQGQRFKQAVQDAKPLQVLGTINAYTALLAKTQGAKAIYLSGAGVANASYGLPDLGMTNLADVLEDARRITDACDLPLLVDVDTGWDSALTIARTVKSMEKAAVAAIHIEDQIMEKRCGHRPNKRIVSLEAMEDRIKAAVDARTDPDFVIMARTDAYAVEGMQAVIDRSLRCLELGADMIFPEAMPTLADYQKLTKALPAPVLANITEFGKTPLFSRDELDAAGIALILYPLSAFRAMAQAAMHTYQTILEKGSQETVVAGMQTREALYTVLDYHKYEAQLDKQIKDGV